MSDLRKRLNSFVPDFSHEQISDFLLHYLQKNITVFTEITLIKRVKSNITVISITQLVD